MPSEHTSHIVSPTPQLTPSADRRAGGAAPNCVEPPAHQASAYLKTARDPLNPDDVLRSREAAQRDCEYFNSLRKVGSDALLYQSRE